MCPGPRPGGFPSPSFPVELSGIEPDRQRLQGAPATSATQPHRGAAPGTGLSPGVAGLSSAAPHQCRGRMAPAADAHAMDMSKSKHVRPQAVLCRGGRTRTPDAQFWRLPFWPLNYAPMADPYKGETARRKSPRAVPGDSEFGLTREPPRCAGQASRTAGCTNRAIHSPA